MQLQASRGPHVLVTPWASTRVTSFNINMLNPDKRIAPKPCFIVTMSDLNQDVIEARHSLHVYKFKSHDA